MRCIADNQASQYVRQGISWSLKLLLFFLHFQVFDCLRQRSLLPVECHISDSCVVEFAGIEIYLFKQIDEKNPRNFQSLRGEQIDEEVI